MYLNWHRICNVEKYLALDEEWDWIIWTLFSFQVEKWVLFLTFQNIWIIALLDAKIIYKVTLGYEVLMTPALDWNGLNKILKYNETFITSEKYVLHKE